MKIMPLIFAISMLFLATACGIPFSKKVMLPDDIGKKPSKVIARLNALQEKIKQTNLSMDEGKKFLNIKADTPGVTDIITAADKKKALYSDVQIIGSPNEVREFGEELEKHEITSISFHVKEKSLSSLLPYSATVVEEGPKFTAYLIAYDGKLIRVKYPKNFHNKEKTTNYITELIPTALNQGLKAIP